MIGIIRDKEYELTTGKEGSRIVYLTDNPNGNAEIVTLILSPNSKARNKIFDFDFASLQIKGRNSQGNIVTKYTIKKIQLKVAGQSTLGALEIWYDEHIGKLNTEARGKSLGTFQEEDRVLVIYQGGYYMLTNYALSNHYEPDQVLVLEKFDPNCTVSVVYYDGKTKQYYVKRFHIETTLADKKFNFISEAKNSKLILATTILTPQINIGYKVSANQSAQSIVYDLGDIPVKGWKTVGSKLSKYTITSVTLSSTEK